MTVELAECAVDVVVAQRSTLASLMLQALLQTKLECLNLDQISLLYLHRKGKGRNEFIILVIKQKQSADHTTVDCRSAIGTNLH